MPENVIPDLTKALDKAKSNYTLEVAPGTLHGFMFAERQAYAPVQSEDAWTKLFDLWDRNLKK